MRFQRKTFSCEALRINLTSGVAFRQLVIKKRRDFQSSPETYALSVHSGLVILFNSALLGILIMCGTLRAQIGVIQGRVLFRHADGQTVPLQDATVDVFGLDTGATFESKTNKEGYFIRTGMEHKSIYLLAVSAAHARPAVVLKRTSFDLNNDDIILEAGDGKRLILEEALAMIEPSRLIGIRALNIGEAALRDRKYEEAIAKFEEGIAATPDEPTLWIDKSTAYKRRGFERHVLSGMLLGTGANAARMSPAGQAFRAAFESGKRAVELVKTLPVPTNPGTLARYKYNTYADQ